MIKKYKEFIKESLLNHLKGPSIDDIENNLLNGSINIQKYIDILKKHNFGIPDINILTKYFLNGKIDVKKYIRILKMYNFGEPDKNILKEYFMKQYNKNKITFKEYVSELGKYNLELPSKQEYDDYYNNITKDLLSGKIDVKKYINNLKINNFGEPDKNILKKYFKKQYKLHKISFKDYVEEIDKYNLEIPLDQEYNDYYNEITKEYQDGKMKLERYCLICLDHGFKLPPKEEIKELFLTGRFDFETYLYMCKKKGFDTFPTLDEIKKICLEKPGDEYDLRKYIMRFKFDVTKEEKYIYYKKNYFNGEIDYDDFINYQIVKMFIDDETKSKAYSLFKEKGIPRKNRYYMKDLY